jgi:SulP family sulfate permease
VIDVREPREYRQAHIPEAEHLPYLDLIEDLDQVSRGMPVVLVCEGGRRSTHAAAMLIARGTTTVEVLDGGMTGWVRQRLLTAVELKR